MDSNLLFGKSGKNLPIFQGKKNCYRLLGRVLKNELVVFNKVHKDSLPRKKDSKHLQHVSFKKRLVTSIHILDLLFSISFTAFVAQMTWRGLILQWSTRAFIVLDQNGSISESIESSEFYFHLSFAVHPHTSTWNLKIDNFPKGICFSRGPFFGFHVSFLGRMYFHIRSEKPWLDQCNLGTVLLCPPKTQ